MSPFFSDTSILGQVLEHPEAGLNRRGLLRRWEEQYTVRLATQSGPALVLSGEIHSVFKPNSRHFNIRNGIGVRADGTVVFAISQTGVRFYDFATLYRDVLHCPNALYLDGAVSALWTEQSREAGGRYSGILVVATQP